MEGGSYIMLIWSYECVCLDMLLAAVYFHSMFHSSISIRGDKYLKVSICECASDLKNMHFLFQE